MANLLQMSRYQDYLVSIFKHSYYQNKTYPCDVSVLKLYRPMLRKSSISSTVDATVTSLTI